MSMSRISNRVLKRRVEDPNRKSDSRKESESESHTVDEGVQDRHGTVGDTSVRVNLLENLVDVGGVGLLPGLGTLLLLASGGGLLGVLNEKVRNRISVSCFFFLSFFFFFFFFFFLFRL